MNLMHRTKRCSSTSKRSCETEAEAVAFVVCQAIGLETGSAAQDLSVCMAATPSSSAKALNLFSKPQPKLINAIGAGLTVRFYA